MSLIEDEENEEKDLLMDEDEDLEADGETSENEQSEVYVMAINEGRKRILERQKKPVEVANNNEHYYGFYPAINTHGRQPMMGVNISTLSGKNLIML